MNVLVVDDQKEVVSGLLGGLHWAGLSVENAYPAYSAEDARQVFREHPIDIMLCDIEMPRENGLSLFRWVGKEYSQTECIFLTSHAEFRYAKEAISLGGADYILQPARYDEIEDSIRKARRKVLKRKQIQKIDKVQTYKDELSDSMASGYLQDMIHYQSNADQNLNKIFLLELKKNYKKLKIYLALQQIVTWKSGYPEWEGVLLRSSILNIFREIFIARDVEIILLKLDKQFYVLLICAEEENINEEEFCAGMESYKQFEDEYLEFSSALYVGGTIEPYEFIDKLNYLRDESRHNIMKQGKIMLLDGKKSNQSYNKMVLFHTQRWDEMLMNGKGDQIKKEIVRYFDNSKNQLYDDSEILKELHCSFTKSLFYVLQKNNIDIRNVFNKEYSMDDYLASYDSYDDFLKAIDFIIKIQSMRRNELSPLEEEDQVSRAIQYIRDNLDKKITRKELAEYVFLNEDYLSRLFKKQTGYMVKEYILHEKIEAAKELLASTGMSVSLIALKVGFDNFSYFSQIFKKLTMLPPNDYRNQTHNGQTAYNYKNKVTIET